MRWLALTGILLVISALVVGFSARGGPNTETRRPALQVVRSIPLTVRGERFRAAEHVRVSTGAHSARTTARTNGVFVVAIRGATRCDTVRVVARGSAGSYAVVKLVPPPMCMPARSG